MIERFKDGDDVVIVAKNVPLWERDIFAQDFMRNTFYNGECMFMVELLGTVGNTQLFHAHRPGYNDAGIVYAFVWENDNDR